MRGRRIQVGAISVTLYARHKKNFHHDQRPRFDDGGTKWNAPTDTFQLLPPTGETAHLTLAPQLFPTLQIKGFHYNRPPPIR